MRCRKFKQLRAFPAHELGRLGSPCYSGTVLVTLDLARRRAGSRQSKT